MATCIKRSGKYRFQIRVAGHSESQTFGRKADGVAWAAQRETELRNGGRSASGIHTLANMIDDYIEKVAPTRRGARWEKIRLTALKREIKFVGARLAKIDEADWSTWRDDRLVEVSGSTVGRELALISTMYEVARREWKWVKHNPIRDIKKPVANKSRTRLFMDHEVESIIGRLGYVRGTVPITISQRVALALLVSLETAMRAGELCSLRRENLNLKAGVAYLPITKNGDSRNVPLITDAAIELLELAQGKDVVFDLKTSQVDALFRKARDKLSIVDLHFHDARATALTRLSRKVDVMTLSKVSGHRDINMLNNVYYRETAESISMRVRQRAFDPGADARG